MCWVKNPQPIASFSDVAGVGWAPHWLGLPTGWPVVWIPVSTASLGGVISNIHQMLPALLENCISQPPGGWVGPCVRLKAQESCGESAVPRLGHLIVSARPFWDPSFSMVTGNICKDSCFPSLGPSMRRCEQRLQPAHDRHVAQVRNKPLLLWITEVWVACNVSYLD